MIRNSQTQIYFGHHHVAVIAKNGLDFFLVDIDKRDPLICWTIICGFVVTRPKKSQSRDEREIMRITRRRDERRRR